MEWHGGRLRLIFGESLEVLMAEVVQAEAVRGRGSYDVAAVLMLAGEVLEEGRCV